MKVGDLVRVKNDHQYIAIVLSVRQPFRVKVYSLDGLTVTFFHDPFVPYWEVISESR